MLRKGARRHEVLELLEHLPVIDADAVKRVAAQTGVPEADVWGSARFYTLLTRKDPGLRLCQGLTCKLAGSDALSAQLTAEGVAHSKVSCLGQCDRAPAAIGADLHIARSSGDGGPVSADDPNLPMNLGGPNDATYAALAKAQQLGADAVLAQLEASGLQGRGGAGFPAHIKWRAVRDQAADQHSSPQKYVVCNADEAEPGTFKDRQTMLRRPHRVLEGLAIAALVARTTTIYVYIRGEYPACRTALETARAQAGDTLAHLDFVFVSGHGAYICGEETALLESIEGKRGMPRLKPPYPTVSGLFGKPTLINNVETLACVPDIVLRGGQRFRALGRTEAGTKLYSISGHVAQPGVYELPLGVSLDELVAVAGGYLGTPMAFSPGGASSGFLPMSCRDTPLDFKALAAAGSMLGSAGVVVLNDTVDMALAALQQAVFFEDESCGQCAPCRIGTCVLRRALDRYAQTRDTAALAHLGDVAWELEEGSICGLGMVAAWPLTSAMKHFPAAFGR